MTLENMSDQELAALIRECLKTGKSVDAALKEDVIEVGDRVAVGLSDSPSMVVESIFGNILNCVYFDSQKQIVRVSITKRAVSKY